MFHVDHDLSIPLRPVTGKAFKSMVSGAVKFQKTFLSNSHLGSGEAVRIPRSESILRSKSRNEERHMLNFQIKQYQLTVLMAWIDDFVFVSQTAQTSSTKLHAFYLVYSFSSPLLFYLLSAPKTSLLNWFEIFLKSEKAAVISIFLVVLRVISGLLYYIFSCCLLYNNLQTVSDFFIEILSLMCL